jgi:hypothetical protein
MADEERGRDRDDHHHDENDAECTVTLSPAVTGLFEEGLRRGAVIDPEWPTAGCALVENGHGRGPWSEGGLTGGSQ